VPFAIPLRAFYEVVRSEPRIKGIGVDHGAGYIHVDVRETVEPVSWIYRNGRAVVTTDPFLDVVNAESNEVWRNPGTGRGRRSRAR